MSMWAGESVSGVKKAQTAAEIIQELASEAEMLLRRWR
jgi:NAD(P)H-dependent flavin oxidoreductase YrpB (nitropropane dioxygenase family)